MAALLSGDWEGLFQKYPLAGSLQRTAAFTLFTWQSNQSFVFVCKQPQVRFNVHQGQLHRIHLSIYSSLLDVHVCARIILLLLSGPAFWYDTFMIHFCSKFFWLRACSRSKNSATNEGPGLPSRDRVEIRTGYGAGGSKKIRVFF